MVGQVKNPLHLFNPQLLTLPIFKDIIVVSPFMYRNDDYATNLVNMNRMAISSGSNSWGQNEYGPCWKDVSSTIDTIIPTAALNYNNFTIVSWASTISTDTGRELLAGVWQASDQYIRFGRSGNNFYAYVRVPVGTQSGTIATPNNDGNMHCFILSSNLFSLDMFFDGYQVRDSGTPAGSYLGNSTAFEIGGYFGNTDQWVGNISLTMIWNRGLTPSEARQIYEMGPSLTPLQNNFPIPYRGAIGAGAPSFKAAWAFNSNQVL